MVGTTLLEFLGTFPQPADAIDWLIRLARWLLIAIVAIHAGWPWIDRKRGTRLGGLIALWTCLAAFLCVVRLPVLVAGELNPDEGEELAEALTFLHDFRPWGAADGHTHGFPVPASLLALKLLGLPLDYLGARLIAIGAILLIAAAVGFVVRTTLGQRPAILASTVVCLFMASVSGWDQLAFNGEYVCVLVAMAANLCMLQLTRTDGVKRRWAMAGAAFAIVLLPFAKLQVAPLAAFYGLLAAVLVVRVTPREHLLKELGILAGAAALSLGAVLGLIALGGGFAHFVECYVLDALVYVTIGAWEPHRWTLFVNQSVSLVGLAPWLALLVAATIVAVSRPSADARRISLAIWSSIFATAAVLFYCIYKPNREFPHYLNFILFASSALVALIASQAVALSPRPALASVAVLSAFFWTPGHVLRQAPPSLSVPPYEHSERQAGAVISQFSAPEEAVAVWGWMARYFVLSQRGSASRHAIVTEREVYLTRNAETFRAEYLQDLSAKNPPVFVDAVGPGSFAYEDRAKTGHESFPKLAELVARSYEFAGEVGRVRIYVRKDRLAQFGSLPLAPDGEELACLHAPTEGASVALGHCGGSSRSHQLQLERVGPFFQLRDSDRDLCVQVGERLEGSWTAAAWRGCRADEPRQQWALIPEGEGRKLVSSTSLECLGANRENGKVLIRRCRGVSSEVWPDVQSGVGKLARSE